MNESSDRMPRALFVYVNESQTGLSGKARKIEEGFREAGYKLDTIYFGSKVGKIGRLIDWIKVQLRFIYLILRRRYDVIFVRYAYYFFPMFVIGLVLRRKIQIDINTNIWGEHLSSGRKLRAKIDTLVIWVALKSAFRVHAVSRELQTVFKAKYPWANVCFTPNFVVDESCPWNALAKKQQQKTNLLFLGNVGQKWHGIPKFIQKIILGNDWFAENCVLHVVGAPSLEASSMVTQYGLDHVVVQHGFQSGEQKCRTISQMDIGISGFDLGAIGLKETTGIKNGEYLYSGLALVLGYEDPAIPSHLPFVLSIDLDSDPDVRSRLRGFVEEVSQNAALSRSAYTYARENLLVGQYIHQLTV